MRQRVQIGKCSAAVVGFRAKSSEETNADLFGAATAGQLIEDGADIENGDEGENKSITWKISQIPEEEAHPAPRRRSGDGLPKNQRHFRSHGAGRVASPKAGDKIEDNDLEWSVKKCGIACRAGSDCGVHKTSTPYELGDTIEVNSCIASVSSITGGAPDPVVATRQPSTYYRLWDRVDIGNGLQATVP